MDDIANGQVLAEHRRYPRKKLEIKVQYKDALPNSVAPDNSASLNISAGGLAIQSDREVHKEQLINLTLHLPAFDIDREGDESSDLEIEAAAVEILARVAWVNKNGPSDYMMGVHILDVRKEEREVLNRFLIEFQLDGPDFELYK